MERENTTVTWPSSDNTLDSGNSHILTSDAFVPDQHAVHLLAGISADNSNGSPASDDVVLIKVLYSTDGGTTFDSQEAAPIVARLDTTLTDPLVVSISVNPTASQMKFYAYADGGATNDIDVDIVVSQLETE